MIQAGDWRLQKAVIMARGLGTRMRQSDDSVSLTRAQQAAADSGVKALVPLGRPFLDYVLSALADAGFQHVCLIVAPGHTMLRDYYEGRGSPTRLDLQFAVQAEALGTADAVAAAEEFAAGGAFVVLNSDNYYPTETLAALRVLPGPGLAAFERDSMFASSNVTSERLTSFAVVETRGDGTLSRIIEKPSQELIDRLPRPIAVSMNCWRFDADIFSACAAIEPSARGELEITDAVQYCIEELGTQFRVVPSQTAVLDLSRREDIPSVADRLAAVEVCP